MILELQQRYEKKRLQVQVLAHLVYENLKGMHLEGACSSRDFVHEALYYLSIHCHMLQLGGRGLKSSARDHCFSLFSRALGKKLAKHFQVCQLPSPQLGSPKSARMLIQSRGYHRIQVSIKIGIELLCFASFHLRASSDLDCQASDQTQTNV